MENKANKPKWGAMLFILTILSLLAAPFAAGGLGPSAVRAQDPGGFTLYLPSVPRSLPPASIFGATTLISSLESIDQVENLGGSWTRVNLFWSAIENVEDVFWYGAVTGFEAKLIEASQKNLNVIVSVIGTPQWALKPGYSCGAVDPSKFEKLQKFLSVIVDRYSKAPYNVKYWELWNEPDGPDLHETGQVFGCWGDPNDEYNGGRHYGEMLKAVYPIMKSAGQDIQVMIGGLLMDCDPRNPPAGKTCPQGRFLEGILVAGAGSSFDGVSFHAYDYYGNQTIQYANGNWHTSFADSGPVLNAKTDYILSLLNNPAYNAQGKFLMNTEVALLCDACQNDSDFEMAKANYIAQSYAAAIAKGLKANLWFTIPGWRNSGLVDANMNPLPAYTAYQFAMKEIGFTHLSNEITTYANVQGYELTGTGKRVWVIWAKNGQTMQITLPENPVAIYNSMGVPQGANGNRATVSGNPLYIEFVPR